MNPAPIPAPDPLALALIAAGVEEAIAHEAAERAAILEYDGRINKPTAELIATGGWEP